MARLEKLLADLEAYILIPDMSEERNELMTSIPHSPH
jgi:hypothetical protein